MATAAPDRRAEVPVVAEAGRRPVASTVRRLRRGTVERILLGIGGFALIVVPWHIAAESGIASRLILPTPTATLRAFAGLFASPELLGHAQSTLGLLGLGYALSAVSGIAIGGLAGWFRTVQRALSPYMAFLDATPSVALMPLLIVWLGLGLAPKLAVLLLAAFFPFYWTTLASVRSLDHNLVRVARAYGASEFRVFRSIMLPASVPHLLVGARIAFGKAVVATVVVELLASSTGVGFLLHEYGREFRSADVFAVILLIAVFAVVIHVTLRYAESRVDSWRAPA
jgi:ABC-type nitrate/sulfonate/bicarbonate transport system permease component